MVTYAYTTINNVDTRFGITMKADPEIILVPPKRDFNASGTLTCMFVALLEEGNPGGRRIMERIFASLSWAN